MNTRCWGCNEKLASLNVLAPQPGARCQAPPSANGAHRQVRWVTRSWESAATSRWEGVLGGGAQDACTRWIADRPSVRRSVMVGFIKTRSLLAHPALIVQEFGVRCFARCIWR